MVKARVRVRARARARVRYWEVPACHLIKG